MTTQYIVSDTIVAHGYGIEISAGDDLTIISGVSLVAEADIGAVLDGPGSIADIEGGLYGDIGLQSGSGNTVIVVGRSGIVEGAANTAMELFGPFQSVRNGGDIISAVGDGIFIGGNGATVSNTGFIAANASGVHIGGLNSQIVNDGTITGVNGIFFDSVVGSALDEIDNNGTILCADEPGTGGSGISNSTGDAMFVNNAGHITASSGIVFNGGSGLTDTLDNSGSIAGIDAMGVEEEGAAALVVNNSGVISGSIDALAFLSSSANDVLDNTGTVHGSITALAATLRIVNAGHITGAILFGSNADTYDGSQGTISGMVLAGAGNDVLTGGAGNDHFDGGTGNDVLSGNGGNDTIAAEGATATIDGGDGNDVINMASFFNASDQIEGGAGVDTLNLAGDYSAGISFGASTISDIDRIVMADGNTYKLVMDDGNVAAGEDIRIDASALTGTNTLKFFGSAETDGRYVVYGGAGNDNIVGGAGNDIFYGNAGANRFTGGGGADRIIATGTSERFIYTDVTDSTSTTHDIITGFVASTDRFDLETTVTGVDTAVTSGLLRAGTFDTNLAADIGSAQLAAGHAVLFTASSGNLAGHTYLIVDDNGVAGYQAGQDYVMELVGGTLTGLSTADFI